MELHHVQVPAPPGGEDTARTFYRDALGMTEVEKPEELRTRGGVWFRSFDEAGEVSAEIHVGIEEPFSPAKKAHPALLLASREEFTALGQKLERQGFEVDRSQRWSFDGYERLHTRDGHGNRVELLAAL